MNNFNRQIYSFVFGAEATVVDGVVVGSDGVVVVAGVDVVCAVVDVLFAVANVFAVLNPVICIGCDEDVVMAVDVKQKISY